MFNHIDLNFNHRSKLRNDQSDLELMDYGWMNSGVPIKSLHVDIAVDGGQGTSDGNNGRNTYIDEPGSPAKEQPG